MQGHSDAAVENGHIVTLCRNLLLQLLREYGRPRHAAQG